MNQQAIGLALSGGGARGYMHIGVLQAMDELQCSPRYLSGCSSGAMIAALYAAGHRPKDIYHIIQQLKIYRLIKPAWSAKGLLSLSPLAKWLSQHLPKTFEELTLPLTVNATDLLHQKPVYFSQGPLIPALIASSCLPVLFKPVIIGQRELIDGGVLDNLPINGLPTEGCLRWASSCNHFEDVHAPKNMFQITERTLRLTVNQNSLAGRASIDLLFEPPQMGQFRVFDFHKVEAIYEVGYQYAVEKLRKLG